MARQVTTASSIAQSNTAQQMSARFEQLRPGIERAGTIGGGRNVALAQYEINGIAGELVGVSDSGPDRLGAVAAPAVRFFNTIAIGNPRPWDRVVDAEYKLFETVAQKFATQPGVYNDVQGVLNIWTKFEACESCQGVKQQFEQMFPNVIVKLVAGH